MTEQQLMTSTAFALAAALIASAPILAESHSSVSALDLDRNDSDQRTFATEAGLDWYLEQRRIADELKAEHLLATLHEASIDATSGAGTKVDAARNGGFENAELEQAAHALADPRVIELLETSAYYAAIVEGRMTVED
jgi:hypothetical protein